jgi:uncharacterized membrane protein
LSQVQLRVLRVTTHVGGRGEHLRPLIHPIAWKRNSANYFAVKLSEKAHERANRLAIRRLIAM